MKLREKISFITTFENGVIKQTQYSILTLLKYEPSKIAVTVEPIRSTRSLNQLAYYWGIVLPEIAGHTGHTAAELHEIFKRLLLPPRVVKFKGREIKMAGTTTTLSKEEMGEFIERVVIEAGEMGIAIPPADPLKSTKRLDA
jgi:hypothetical protein